MSLRWSMYVTLLTVFLLHCGLAIELEVPCYDDTWFYSSDTGKCYKKTSRQDPLTWMDAVYACGNLSTTEKVSLVSFGNAAEMRTVVHQLLRSGLMENVWLGAQREGPTEPFRWHSSGQNADFTFIEWSGGFNLGNCMELIYHVTPGTVSWMTDATVENLLCTEKRNYFCEHEVPHCKDAPGGFNKSTMQFTPSEAYPRATVAAVCQKGMYMQTSADPTRVNGPNVNMTLLRNEYHCSGRRDQPQAAQPSLYKPEFKYSGYNVTECLQTTPDPDPGQNYAVKPLNTVIPLQCNFGYVNVANKSSRNTTVQCLQRDLYATEGVWIPENYQPCVAVRCQLAQLQLMNPENGILASARNHLTDRVYGPQQVNEFPLYGNVISIRCKPGYLYPDRTVVKEVQCGLTKDSETKGEYYGYSGTILPIPNRCEITTCPYETAVIKPEFNMESHFMANNATSNWINLTKHDGQMYALGAQLRFFCQNGFETVNQEREMNITCGDTGSWMPQLIGCIAQTADIPLSSDGRFHGEREEAKSAKEISSIMFILTFIFLGFVLLLDLTTVGRDAKQLIRNIKLQKKRYQAGKQKRLESEASASNYSESDQLAGFDSNEMEEEDSSAYNRM